MVVACEVKEYTSSHFTKCHDEELSESTHQRMADQGAPDDDG